MQFVFILSRSIVVVYGVDGCGYPWQERSTSPLMIFFLMNLERHFENNYIVQFLC